MIEDGYGTRPLVGLIPWLSEELLDQVLQDSKKMTEVSRATVLTGLAPHLPERLFPEALDVARMIKYAPSRSKALGKLALCLKGDLRGSVLDEALTAAQAIDNITYKVDPLLELVPHLPEGQKEKILWEALTVAQELSALGGGISGYRIQALLKLAPYLSGELREEVIREVMSETLKAKGGFNLLSPLLPIEWKEEWRETLMAAGKIKKEDKRAGALAGLLPHLPHELLKAALPLAQSLSEANNRVIVFDRLASRLVELPLTIRLSLWEEIVSYSARRTRKDLLIDLRTLAPVIFSLGGVEAIEETFRAIQDVARWWP